jgi:hypothetical protein
MMEVLGKENTLARLKKAIAFMQDTVGKNL